jgi:hypothetical protein
MALVQNSLGLGRVGLKKVYFIEADKIEKQWDTIVGRVESTTQTFERYRQLAPLAPAVQTPEGTPVAFDDPYVIFSRDFYPVKFTKGVRMSEETSLTDQYAKIKNMMPQFATSFGHRKNIVAANLLNLGFTDTSYGMNSETLWATSHSMGAGNTFSNRPATDIAFGPLAIEQCLQEIRVQKQARNQPMPYSGKVQVMVPPQLEFVAQRFANTNLLPGTNNNDVNYARGRVNIEVLDYLTSSTAWFARTEDNSRHGLFMLSQKPFDIDQLPLNESLQYTWVAREIYVVGWYDAHGTWGTTGA